MPSNCSEMTRERRASRAEGVARGGTSVTDYVRVAEGNAVGRGRVDSSVHAGYWELVLEDSMGEMGVLAYGRHISSQEAERGGLGRRWRHKPYWT